MKPTVIVLLIQLSRRTKSTITVGKHTILFIEMPHESLQAPSMVLWSGRNPGANGICTAMEPPDHTDLCPTTEVPAVSTAISNSPELNVKFGVAGDSGKLIFPFPAKRSTHLRARSIFDFKIEKHETHCALGALCNLFNVFQCQFLCRPLEDIPWVNIRTYWKQRIACIWQVA